MSVRAKVLPAGRAVLLVVVLALVVPVLGPVGRAWAMGSVDAFVAQYNNQFVDVDGVYGAQCTDLFNRYHMDVMGGHYVRMGGNGGAKNLWTTSNSEMLTLYDRVDRGAPAQKGDVAVFGNGTYGHVAIVLADGGSLQVFQQNDCGTNGAGVNNCPARIGTISKGALLGYFRPKGLTPPAPTDTDSDGVPDSSDKCTSLPGPSTYSGCPEAIAIGDAVSPQVDFNGDGRADYCRVVGGNTDQHVQCTLSTGSGFGATYTSGALDWGYEFGRTWVDVSGDGRADYCRRVGGDNNVSSRVQCTLSTGSGFGATVTSGVLDWGFELGRTWTDFNGDGRADYCRVVGGNTDQHVQCTLSTGSGFGATYTSGALDWGYGPGRTWVDVSGDGRADYCRRVGGDNNVSSRVQCTLSTGSGFGATVTSGVLDWGFELGRTWTDFNGDGRADYCRVVGGNTDQHVQCTLSTGSGFGATYTSGALDWGYGPGRTWVDVSGDGRADYCRRVGGDNNVSSRVQCTLSTGSGFGATVTSGVLDWGYELGRAWVDSNADGKADYCRAVGGTNLQESHVQCTLSTGSGFGATNTSGVVDYGYGFGRAWTGRGWARVRPQATVIVSGTVRVGSTLTAKAGVWAPAPVTLAYQWLRNGAAISGATKSVYALTPSDLNSTVSVRVTGSRSGYSSVARTSVVTSRVLPALVLSGPVPSVSGVVRVGGTLSVKVGVWQPAPVVLGLQWLRNGVPIVGATKVSYVLTSADLGRVVSVRVTGSRAGYASLARTSAATVKVVAGVLSAPVPKVSGTKRVGRTLTVKLGTWAPAPVVLGVQWYRSGKPIVGATGVTYRLVKADKGKRLTVKVTGAKAGYTTVTKTSKKTSKIKK